MERALARFGELPLLVRILLWFLFWPVLGCLYLWRRSKVGASFVLAAGIALYAAAATTTGGEPAALPVPPDATPTVHASASEFSPTPTSSSPSPTARAASRWCRATPLANVYHPGRLVVLARCKAVTGTVRSIKREPDGDVHLDLEVDARYRGLVNAANVRAQHGWLVVEIVPADEPGCVPGHAPRAPVGTYDYGTCTGTSVRTPAVGSRVTVIGPYVDDTVHGWMEIHPAWHIDLLSGAWTTPRTSGQTLEQASGATARCADGSYSYSTHRSGTCSHHGGVAYWIDKPAT